MDHGDCPAVSSKPSDPQQRRPDGRMYFVSWHEGRKLTLISHPAAGKSPSWHKRHTDRDHLALGRHVGGSVAESESRLERVERRLELGFLVDFGRLVRAAVIAKLGQLAPSARHSVVGRAILKPRTSATYPLQQLTHTRNDTIRYIICTEKMTGKLPV